MYFVRWSSFALVILLLGMVTSTIAGTTYTTKELKVWAKQMKDKTGYYSEGDMQASLGASNQYSPEDGKRILRQADDFKNSASRRLSDYYNSSSLRTSNGVVVSGADGEPHPEGKYLRDCAFVSACHRVNGDLTLANAYATPVITQLLAHANEPLLNFGGRSDPKGPNYRWPVQNSDYLSSGANPAFAIAEWLTRLFLGYDYVRPLMTAAQIKTMDGWFLGAAKWVAIQNNNEQNKLYGNGGTDRLSGAEPYFESYANARDATDSSDGGNQLPIYYNGPLCGGFKRYYFTNRHVTLSSLPYLVGLDQNDTMLIKTGEYFYKEMLVYGVFPNGDHADLSRSFTDDTPTQAIAGEPEKGFNYYMSVIGRMVLMAEWGTRNGRNLAAYGTTKGAFNTSDGKTRKDLLLMCNRAMTYFSNTNNPNKYASVTATTNPDLRIDGIDGNLQVISDTWCAPINIFYKNATLRAAYLRTATGSRPYPENPANTGPNQPWGGHGEAVPGVLFMYGGKENSEASDYSVTSRPQGSQIGAVTSTSIEVQWSNPLDIDDRIATVVIEMGAAATGPFTVTRRVPITTSSPALKGTVTGLTPSTKYYFRLKAESIVGSSTGTTPIQATTASSTSAGGTTTSTGDTSPVDTTQNTSTSTGDQSSVGTDSTINDEGSLSFACRERVLSVVIVTTLLALAM